MGLSSRLFLLSNAVPTIYPEDTGSMSTMLPVEYENDQMKPSYYKTAKVPKVVFSSDLMRLIRFKSHVFRFLTKKGPKLF
jgi:hypothetical protein